MSDLFSEDFDDSDDFNEGINLLSGSYLSQRDSSGDSSGDPSNGEQHLSPREILLKHLREQSRSGSAEGGSQTGSRRDSSEDQGGDSEKAEFNEEPAELSAGVVENALRYRKPTGNAVFDVPWLRSSFEDINRNRSILGSLTELSNMFEWGDAEEETSEAEERLDLEDETEENPELEGAEPVEQAEIEVPSDTLSIWAWDYQENVQLEGAGFGNLGQQGAFGNGSEGFSGGFEAPAGGAEKVSVWAWPYDENVIAPSTGSFNPSQSGFARGGGSGSPVLGFEGSPMGGDPGGSSFPSGGFPGEGGGFGSSGAHGFGGPPAGSSGSPKGVTRPKKKASDPLRDTKRLVRFSNGVVRSTRRKSSK